MGLVLTALLSVSFPFADMLLLVANACILGFLLAIIGLYLVKQIQVDGCYLYHFTLLISFLVIFACVSLMIIVLSNIFHGLIFVRDFLPNISFCLFVSVVYFFLLPGKVKSFFLVRYSFILLIIMALFVFVFDYSTASIVFSLANLLGALWGLVNILYFGNNELRTKSVLHSCVCVTLVSLSILGVNFLNESVYPLYSLYVLAYLPMLASYVIRKPVEITVEQSEETSQTIQELQVQAEDASERVEKQQQELAQIIEEMQVTNRLLTNERNLNLSQRILFEKQSKDLTDSIRYAKRIQNTIIRGENVLRHNFKEFFILDMPRDIVSGDFYWAIQKHGKTYLAVADCTGHGVPGAFMSIIGITYLNNILASSQMKHPNDILFELRNRIITTFSSQESDEGELPKDGMDITLICIDKSTMTLEFAGAYNPIYIVRNSTLAPIRGDKNPISIYASQDVPYRNQVININHDDVIYMFTDGFADQFGWKTGKKFKYNKMQELFLEINELPLEAQHMVIKKTFSTWKGDLDQVDDVLVLGIKM